MTEARALASCDGAFGAFADSLQEFYWPRPKFFLIRDTAFLIKFSMGG
jgi:hypothetical protein